MVTTKQFRDWIKTNLTDYGEWCGIGKMDTTKTKAICVYPNNKKDKPITIVGGDIATGYCQRNFQLLLRWGIILDEAETKAIELHSLFKNNISTISGYKICLVVQNNEPVFLGTDDKGIYEYSFDIKMYCEKSN